MSFCINDWLALLVERLRERFGVRLLFAGLQGSYRRGEAAATSDVDVVVILDELEPADLRAYRRLLVDMPYREKACGFICGRGELAAWPAYDRCLLALDTRPLWGETAGLLPPPAREDAAQAAHIGAANLYHAACHGYLYEEDPAVCLSGLYKGAYFVLAAEAYARDGEYPPSRAALLERLTGTDREILAVDRQAIAHADGEEAQRLFETFFHWVRRKIAA